MPLRDNSVSDIELGSSQLLLFGSGPEGSVERDQRWWLGPWKASRRWSLPEPMAAPVSAISSWVRVVTGLDLDENGSSRVLDEDEWKRYAEVLGVAEGTFSR